MTFDVFVEEIKKIRCQEKRVFEADYVEVVVTSAVLPNLRAVLDGYFGTAVKSAGEKPSREVAEQAAPYGGIQVNQVMYCHQGERGAELALLWPWGSGNAITVKIIRK